MNVLLIDHHDSFTHNLAHLIAQANSNRLPLIVQNTDFADLASLLRAYPVSFSCIVLSPGPGHPSASCGLAHSCLASCNVPVLGVCLGMQSIALYFGGTVQRAPRPMHGQLSPVVRTHHPSRLFSTPAPTPVVRYHSLGVTLPPDSPLLATLICPSDGVMMALEHATRPIFGVQFHPESIGAGPSGLALVQAFLSMCQMTAVTVTPLPQRMPSPATTTTALAVLHQVVVPSSFSPSAAFDLLFRPSFPHCCWLDTSKPAPSSSLTILGLGSERLSLFVDRPASPSAMLIRKQTPTADVCCRGVDLLSLLQASIVARRTTPLPPLPFTLGYVGVLGYTVRHLCPLPLATTTPTWQPSPPALARRTPDASFLFCDRAILFDHQSGQAHVLALAPHAAWLASTVRALAQPAPEAAPPAPLPALALRPALSRLQYCSKVRACLNHLLDGDSYEICLTTQAHGDLLTPLDACAFYQALRASNPAPFSALLPLSPLLALACSSPERFLSVRAGLVESRPIKGTAARVPADPAADARAAHALEHSVKDRAENLMIVDLTRNELSRVCVVGSVVCTQLLKVESYAHVHQLVSAVQGRLEPGRTALDAVRAAFPPPSMTGAPKLRTMELLDALETEPRGLYSGALGFVSLSGDADFNVVIRSALLTPDRVSVGAGGAVTVLSDPDDEYNEMLLKLRTLGLAVVEKQDTNNKL